MKKDIIAANYTVDSKVIVKDVNHLYAGKEGIVIRLGTAGEIIYVHVQLFGINTIITFREFQLGTVV